MLYLYHKFTNKITCVTFGGPRVMNKSLIDKFNRFIENKNVMFRRYVSNGDPIALLPITTNSGDLSYYHPDDDNDKMKYKLCAPRIADFEDIDVNDRTTYWGIGVEHEMQLFHKSSSGMKNTNIIFTHFSGNMCQNFMLIFQLNSKKCIWTRFQYHPEHFNVFFFSHKDCHHLNNAF